MLILQHNLILFSVLFCFLSLNDAVLVVSSALSAHLGFFHGCSQADVPLFLLIIPLIWLQLNLNDHIFFGSISLSIGNIKQSQVCTESTHRCVCILALSRGELGWSHSNENFIFLLFGVFP